LLGVRVVEVCIKVEGRKSILEGKVSTVFQCESFYG
jgi:hypothetical protein